MREHGNAFACVGLTMIQLPLGLRFLGAKVFLENFFQIILLGVFFVVVGLIAWLRAVHLEARQPEVKAEVRSCELIWLGVGVAIVFCVLMAILYCTK